MAISNPNLRKMLAVRAQTAAAAQPEIDRIMVRRDRVARMQGRVLEAMATRFLEVAPQLNDEELGGALAQMARIARKVNR